MSDFPILKEKFSSLFHERREAFGVGQVNLEISFIERSSVADARCFGEAFPQESPPRVVLEVLPDVSEDELMETIADELTHVKHPELDQYGSDRAEFEEKMNECLSA